MRTLTKSRFKLACDWPAKLYYTGKKELQARFRPIRRIAQLRKEIVALQKKARLKKNASKLPNLQRSIDLRQGKLFDEYLKLQLNPK